MTAFNWGPRIDHDGKGGPVHRGVMVRIAGCNSDGTPAEVEEPCDPNWLGWRWAGPMILKYRVRINPHISLMKIKAKALDRIRPELLAEQEGQNDVGRD